MGEPQRIFRAGQRVRYIADSREVKMRPNAYGTIIEVGDIPRKVTGDPRCGDEPLAYTILPEEGGIGQIVYPSEIQSA